jgi:hypothetical protein
MTSILPETITSFISRWENSGAAERANYQMFLAELCDLLRFSCPVQTSIYSDESTPVVERAAEEMRGLIRWLRPDYQNKTANAPQSEQTTLPGTETDTSSQSKIQNQQSSIDNPSSPIRWPTRLPEQVTLIRQLLTTHPTATPDQLSTHFGRKNTKRTEQIEGILETLRGLGQR